MLGPREFVSYRAQASGSRVISSCARSRSRAQAAEWYHYIMDGLRTAAELAGRLGTSVPRVHRAVADGIVTPAASALGGALLFTPEAERELLDRWGSLPTGWPDEIGRSEAFVLAALRKRPRGLRSFRAVATEAGLSPTTAGKALEALRRRGLVALTLRRVVEGTVGEVATWEINWRSADWAALASQVAKVVLPSRTGLRRDARPTHVPVRLGHLFWDVNRESLRVTRHRNFIIRRILGADDVEAWSWLMDTYHGDEILQAVASSRAIEARRRPFAEALAAAAA